MIILHDNGKIIRIKRCVRWIKGHNRTFDPTQAKQTASLCKPVSSQSGVGLSELGKKNRIKQPSTSSTALVAQRAKTRSRPPLFINLMLKGFLLRGTLGSQELLSLKQTTRSLVMKVG